MFPRKQQLITQKRLKEDQFFLVFTPSGKPIHSLQALDPEYLVKKDLTFSLLVPMPPL
jgi:hypothetical protein